MAFKTIDLNIIPKHFESEECEFKWASFWAAHNIYHFDQSKNDTFIVDTPPPTVSGSLHVGHVFSYSHTDFIVRYQRMLGKNIYYPMGWDDNGLPTERRVQNYYNVKCDKDTAYVPDFLKYFEPELNGNPINISRKNFIELCTLLTQEDEKVYKMLWQRLGLSIDWDEEYSTIDDQSRKIAQYSFIDLHKKGHLYASNAPIMWDVDFQTSIAQAEIEDRMLQGEMYHIKFFKEELNGDFEIATTRPELIPACVGVVVNPNDKRYTHMHGTSVITPIFGVKVPVITSELVDIEKGTGIVMVCTFGDATDIDWWREHNLNLRQVIGLNGRFVNLAFGEVGWESLDPDSANIYYSQIIGKTVFSAKKQLLELLETEKPGWQQTYAYSGTSFKVERMVKYYEKGSKPLEFIPSRQWFVNILDIKDAILEKGKEIVWEPDFALKRFNDWTNNLAFDWNISRQRFFGVPIPVWYKIDRNGNIEYNTPILPEVGQLPVDPTVDVPKGYTESQRNKPNGFGAEEDVFDTWFTSSLTPQLSSKWIFDKDRHKKLFPADIRPQSHEIIRTWAFYTIVKAYLHENSIPWKRVLISGWVLDPDRKKMSKSKGNVETPENWIQKYTADGVRYWSARAKIGVDTTFDINVMKNGARLVTKIFNAGKFVLAHKGKQTDISHELDRAFINQLRHLVIAVTKCFNEYDHAGALNKAEDFFWEYFTDSYLELVKTRATTNDESELANKNSAVTTLRVGLDIFLRLFAPFLPYITEEVWSWCFAEEKNQKSIHLAPWPSQSELANIAHPEYTDSFKLAMQLQTEIKRYKSQKQLSYSDKIDELKIEASRVTINNLNMIKKDLMNYSKIVKLEVDINDSSKGITVM